MYKHPIYEKLKERVEEPRSFIQVLAGPRQVGKTTLAHQLIDSDSMPFHYASADDTLLRDIHWINTEWEAARLLAYHDKTGIGALLILDEVQKIPHWSDRVKTLWDQDSLNKINLKVIILGSSTLVIEKGLVESFAGRFEPIPITHWSFRECRDAFGWTVDQYIYFGGYPGGAQLIHDEERWAQYIKHALIETSISKDIMHMARIHKPALLRRLFEIGCIYSGQILSYQKMLGQFHDSGNATTLAHYLELLSKVGLIKGLQKFTPLTYRQRSSSPKLQVLNTALITAQNSLSLKEAQEDREFWGRLVKSTIGAHLINSTIGSNIGVYYWNERSKNVDYVMRKGKRISAITIQSNKQKESLPGLSAFSEKFHPQKKLLVGGQGIPLEEFLLTYPEQFI